MKKTLIAAMIAGVLACSTVFAGSVGCDGLLTVAYHERPAIYVNDVQVQGSGDSAIYTLSSTVAMADSSGSIDSADETRMIGGAGVLAFSIPKNVGIGSGSSNNDQLSCNDGIPGGHGRHEVGWRSVPSA